MKLIWKELLHANYRCGRMHTHRAPASDVYCMVALGCANVHPNVTAAAPVDHTARCAFENASGFFTHNNNTIGI